MATRKAKKPTVHRAELVERPKKDAATRRTEQLALLGGIKQKVLDDSLRVVEDHLRFRDVDPGKDMERDPAFHAMVEELGREQAEKAYRLALAGWQSAADAPVGIKNAIQVSVGLLKAMATENSGPRTLNVGKIMIYDDNVPKFEEVEVE